MVGLSDIPCVGKIVDRISDATVDPLFRGFNYMFFYKDYVNNLNSEIEKLTNQEGRVSRKANAEKNNGKILHADVLKWQTDVEEFQRSATEFSDKYKNRASWRCIHFLPIPKPVSRFRLGREAAQKVKRVTELSDSGKQFVTNEIAYLPTVENVPISDTVFHDFESRKGAYRKLWEELVKEGSSSILGIYGMPGVGKTRLMEQLWKEAKDKKIFDKVTRADVGSDGLDVIKLQKQIAGHLDCHLESQDNLDSRASQLKSCLMNGGKVLIVLDDVWREIPLDAIGIPLVDDSSCKGLKILLTSRKEDVCLRNNCKHPIKITTLTFDEAWALFRNTVGASHIDSMPDISMAHKVCEKCAGLPLLIRGVGKALQFTSHNSWKDALGQLEKGTVENIAGIDPQVYACVKLSIDRLPDDAKSCLFLCSLYPEDNVIYIRKLIQIATGSQLVPDGESRVCTMVDFLRSSSLLLESEEDRKIQLHDLIRDVARSIAVSDAKYAFSLVRCGLRLPDNPDYCTRKLLHLHLEKNDFHFPDGLVCPDLHKLWLQCNRHLQQLSGGFFSMFVNLRFLLIQGMTTSLELQFSLHTLGNLRTLILDDCDMTHISQTNVGFFPENLEILCFWECLLPKPLDLPNLRYLRKLEIEGWYTRVQMLPNTISSLPNLEEFHIPNGFNIEDDGSEQSSDAVSASIMMEISKLIGLKSLQMTFRNSKPFQDTNTFDNLLDYNISVSKNTGYVSFLYSSVSIKRSIDLYGVQLEGLENLIERAEEATLRDTDIDMSSIWNSNRKAFSDLRNLRLQECKTIVYLARISQDEIHSSCRPLTPFSNLTNLEIESCSSLRYLFTKSVAKGLVQLQKLSIESCPVIEAIVTNEDTNDGDIINFCKLKSLSLKYMRRLKSFYREKDDTIASSTSVMDNSAIPWVQHQQPFFDGMVAFPCLEDLALHNLEETGSDIWGKYYYNDDNESSFCKLKSLVVYECEKLETVIPPAMLNRMRNLETIEIWYCNRLRNVFIPCIARDLIHLKEIKVLHCGTMEEIIGPIDQEIIDGIVFPELTVLQLVNLPNLTSFWCYLTREDINYKLEFPNLVNLDLGCEKIKLGAKELGIEDFTCQQLKQLKVSNCGYSTALALSIFRSSPKLEGLEISNSALLEQIVEDVRDDEAFDVDQKTITLLKLRYFKLDNLPNIRRSIFNANFECHMPALTRVKVDNCGISTLLTFSALRSLPQLQKLEISNCSLLEEIVEGVSGDEASGMEKKTFTLFQLRSVILRDLPNLKSFISSANYECLMPALTMVEVDNCGISTLFTISSLRSLQQLQKLEISKCSSLEEIVEGVRGDEASGMDKKTITLFQLISVILRDLPNLKSFFHGANYECHLPALTRVEIDNCGFSTLFTCSVFRKLHQLEKLDVSKCRLLESIVEDGETSSKQDKIITFSRLKYLDLNWLPNLKCFSSNSSYAFSMPNLTLFHMLVCPRIQYFTFLKTSTSMVHVYTGVWDHTPDLNDYIGQKRKRESGSSAHGLETESERVEEELLQDDTEGNDQM